jgi:Mn2+/Fe2+ NRAMP family transporter
LFFFESAALRTGPDIGRLERISQGIEFFGGVGLVSDHPGRRGGGEYKEVTAVQEDREAIRRARERGGLATLSTFVKLSGPGWLQSAITLGGGSLAGALYLGVLGGYSLLWVQPLAMIMGVIMLSAIGYVTLSTGRRPFEMINREINPVLGWGWALAALVANMVWILPQFAMSTAAAQQSLMPGVFGAQAMADVTAKLILVTLLAAASATVVWSYGSGGRGVKLFELILKLMVAVIVLSFFGVVIRMSLGGALPWGEIFRGFIPDVSMLSQPAAAYTPFLDAVDAQFREFWSSRIVADQRDFMITAAAVAVGINMTFLMPYALLKRGWNSEFRGLAIFDLSTGMFIPFLLVTGCVVIASAAQFHTRPAEGLAVELREGETAVQPVPAILRGYEEIARARVRAELGGVAFAALTAEEIEARVAALPPPDRRMAAMLVRRDAFDLAHSLSPLIGERFAQFIFGLGVLGMGLSTAIVIMIINGFVVCEMLGRPGNRWIFRLGAMLPCIGAMLGPFFWRQASFYLVVPVSVLGMMLLPIAYLTFMVMMNTRSLLREHMPRGGARLAWNLLMAVAVALAGLGSFWSVWSRAQWSGIVAIAAFAALVGVVHFLRAGRRSPTS